MPSQCTSPGLTSVPDVFLGLAWLGCDQSMISNMLRVLVDYTALALSGVHEFMQRNHI